MREVRVIPASREFFTGQQTGFSTSKRRVAGYARYSSSRIRCILDDANAHSRRPRSKYYGEII